MGDEARPGTRARRAHHARGWEWALAHAALSHFEPGVAPSEEDWRAAVEASPVRVQWDPERDEALERLPYRSIQVGLSGEAVARYVDDWIVSIDDVTPLAARLRDLPPYERVPLLPEARPYPLPPETAARLGAGVEARDHEQRRAP